MTEDEVSSDIEHPQVPGEEGEALEDLTEQIQEQQAPATEAKPEPEKVSSETASLNMIQDLQNTMSLKVAELAVRAGHLSREPGQSIFLFCNSKRNGQAAIRTSERRGAISQE